MSARTTLRRLLPTAENFAAAAAPQDPGPLLALRLREPSVPAPRRTAWSRSLAAPIRAALAAETRGAVLLVLAIVLALAWTNSPWSESYASFWSARVSLSLGGVTLGNDLRGWVNEGLMTLFFLVVGLEAKRELDLGELRERRRLAIPVLAGLGGMAASTAVYVAITAGRAGVEGWGAAISTDTALALGALTVATRGHAARLRVFLLTVVVVDDLVALLVIAVVYPGRIDPAALVAAAALFAALLALRAVGARHAHSNGSGIGLLVVSVLTGVAFWVALFESGIDPVVSGLLVGLLTSAYAPSRHRLEDSTALAHSFRERPTPELAYSARAGLAWAISPNERLQYRLRPWSSQLIVPVFALANAGIHVDGGLLADAASSPVTLGILAAYVVGKPLGILGAAWLARGRGRLPVTWPELRGTAAAAGVGFTVSLLVAARAFDGPLLEQAKVGVLATAIAGPAVSLLAFALARRAPAERRARQLAGTAPPLVDLVDDADAAHDHIRGREDAPVTLLEYGDYGCRHCGAAAPVVAEVLERLGDRVRHVYRHLPLTDVHPDAQQAAEAAEAAAAQGAFWPMHDRLTADPERLALDDLYRHAHELGLDLDRFFADLGRHRHAARIAHDVHTADAAGVSGTPTFFINGRRYGGPLDAGALAEALAAARPSLLEPVA